jgi:acyl-CoA hydrolase
MTTSPLPPYLAARAVSQGEALRHLVRSGTRLGSGFATSEPSAFYGALWDHIVAEDLTGIEIRQALFMAPHRLLVGDALEPIREMREAASREGSSSFFGALRRQIGGLWSKAEALDKLVEHYRELAERKIRIVSGFLSPAVNTVIPDNVLTRSLYPDWAGRNLARSGILSWQSVHFPDAPDALLLGPEDHLEIDLWVLVMTPPDGEGNLSHGVANGANAEALEILLRHDSAKILLYLNRHYPFTHGHPQSPNTLPAERLRDAAEAGRLFVVEDDTPPPALPADAFDSPSEAERRIAEHVVNHMEMHPQLTHGRALQVGIGGTGVLAVKNLARSSWTGRSYTEMLEPFTLDLFEAGKIAGSHFIEADGRRHALDGKVVATFALGIEGGDFYQRLHRNPAVLLSAASRVVVQEGFYGGLGINNILGIDFHGHVNSSGRDHNPYSGVGGAATILRGLGNGGVAYLCMKSTHRTPEGEERSSIFPYLPQGTPVTLVGPDLMGTRSGARFFLVTEHGVAQINARSQDRFVKSLLSVAHPDHREDLAERAWEELRVPV